MISMARIQGHTLGHSNWQRPIFPHLGQVVVPIAPVDVAPVAYPPIYNYPVQEIPVPAPVTVPAPVPAAAAPNWTLIAAGVAAGVVLTLLLT